MAGMNLIDISRPRVPTKGQTFTPADQDLAGSMLALTKRNFAALVRSGLDSNVVMSPVMWAMRTFAEAPAIVERKKQGQWTIMDGHDLEGQLAYPNPAYSGTLLTQASLISWFLDGNFYWLKVRGRLGQVLEYWYVPHWLITPQWPRDGSRFISHYEYRPQGMGATRPLAPRDVVHCRFGLDPRNPRLGLSPLKSLLREVYSDEEASNFSAAMLSNMGVPGVVISPKDSSVRASPDDVEATKDYVKRAFTGDHRGEALVMGAPTDVAQFGFDPAKMMVAAVRDVAEERVCAAIGIPSAVVGFGSGLQSTKVGATMRELVRLAWVQCIIPNQNSISGQLSMQLLPDYETKPKACRVRFDSSRVSAFAEEETDKVKRVAQKVTSGLQRVDQAQEELGMAPDPSQRVYLRPVNLQAYDEKGEPVGKAAVADTTAPRPPADEPPPPAPPVVDDQPTPEPGA